ncbi:hypothetical protein pb186bvf_018796 [Paramecium bursaria]
MGQSSIKETQLDPNQPSHDPQFTQYLEEQCKTFSNKNYISKTQFDNIFSKLQHFNIIPLQDYPLGDKLFQIMSKENGIQVDDFIHNVKQLAQSKEKRILYSFKIIGKNGKIQQQDFLKYLQEVWIKAFDQLQENLVIQNIRFDAQLLNQWVKKSMPDLQTHGSGLFKKFDKQKNYWDEYNFKEYCETGNFLDVTAQYENIRIQIPLTLIKFRR